MLVNKDIISSVQSFTENRLFIYGDPYMKNYLAYEIRVWLVLPHCHQPKKTGHPQNNK